MLTPEIEQLIDYALADGNVTDAERQVIAKRCMQSGVDVDEMNMILDAKLTMLGKSAPAPVSSSKHGKMRKCPACGAEVGAMQAVCAACGHEFVGVEAVTSVSDLFKSLQALEHASAGSAGGNLGESRAALINTFAVPNTKEDLLEFLVMASTNAYSGRSWLSDYEKAWLQKTNQVYQKFILVTAADPDMLARGTAMVASLVRRLPENHKSFITMTPQLREIISADDKAEQQARKAELSSARRGVLLGWRGIMLAVSVLLIVIGWPSHNGLLILPGFCGAIVFTIILIEALGNIGSKDKNE